MRTIIIALGGFFLISLIVFYAQDRRLAALTESVRELTQAVQALIKDRIDMEPGQIYSSWYSAGNPPILREVKTDRKAGESVDAWKARHNTEVAKLQTTYPPV